MRQHKRENLLKLFVRTVFWPYFFQMLKLGRMKQKIQLVRVCGILTSRSSSSRML